MRAGEVIAGRFVIERLAGAGGMGAVYRAHDRQSSATVALKLMDGRLAEAARFLHEAEILSQLEHPGVVRYVAHGVADAGDLFLAMEWLEGEDLSRRLARGRLEIEESLTLLRLVAEALASVHARGVVHRDIKPSNLFLKDGMAERVKLIDFGLARLPTTPHLTRSGMALGTPGYLAPEQARGEREIGPQADVFALGAVLFECLTGQPAFAGANVMAVLGKLLLDEPPLLRELRPELPGALERLVARMLSKSPAERPAGGAEVAAELATITAGIEGGLPLVEALTRAEQRLLCIVVIGPGPAEAGIDVRGTTHTMPSAAAPPERVAQLAPPYDARVERLADGSTLIHWDSTGSATDEAARAARFALALRAELPELPMALVMGRADLSGPRAAGRAIDRAAALLEQPTRGVRVDEQAASLLEARFEVASTPRGLELRAEREIGESARTLLGRPSPCVGRDRELQLLGGLLDECRREPAARAALITGPAGVGKSRLRHELLRAVRQEGVFDVWIGRGDAMNAGSAFALVASALRHTAGVLGGEPPEDRQQKLAARVAQRVPAPERERVTEFLGELLGASFPDAERPRLRAARQDARIMADQIRRAWEDFVAAACEARPLVIVLEDLHWGDLPSVRLVAAVLGRLAERPLLVLALGRPEVNERFPRLWAERGLVEIRLGALKASSSAQLVRHALGHEANPHEVARIVERAQGHPLYLEELIRAVAEGRSDALPDTVLALVQDRLSALPLEARQVLRAASVFGRVFWRGGAASLLGPEGDALTARWLGELTDREFVAPVDPSRFPGEEQLVFRHEIVREGAYAMLTEEDRALGHELAGAWLERKGETDAIRLAEHFERGRRPERAARWHSEASLQALRGYDLDAAIARAERGLTCGASGELRAALLVELGEAHGWRGENAEMGTCANAALRLAAPGGRVWCMATAGKLLSAALLGQPEVLLEVVAGLREVEPDPDAWGVYVAALFFVIYALATAGQLDMAALFLERMEQISARMPGRDPLVRGYLDLSRGYWATLREANPWSAFEHIQRACARFEEAGDRGRLLLTRSLAGMVLSYLGAYEQAEQTVKGLQSGGHHVLELSFRQALAWVLVNQGAFDEADEELRALIEIARGLRSDFYEGTYRRCRADILRRRGELEEAEREALAAIELLPMAPFERAAALTTLSATQLAQGRAPEALRAAAEIEATRRSLGTLGLYEPFACLVHAEALAATGDHAAAREALREARGRLLARAAKISDPRVRQSFLERVPENARTLALAQQLEIKPAT